MRLVEELFFSLWCLIHVTVWYLIKKKVYEKNVLIIFWSFHHSISLEAAVHFPSGYHTKYAQCSGATFISIFYKPKHESSNLLLPAR